MKLTFEEILSAANGIVRTEENELGLELHRFTREQEGFFYKTHPLYCKESFFNGYFARNCRTEAGVTLDFVSDAKALKFKFGQIEYAKCKPGRIHLLDLYVNGTLVESFKTENEFIYNASGEKSRFTLYFPCYAFLTISAIELEGANVFKPLKKQIDILFLGDSITQGAVAVNPSNAYVSRVAGILDVGILNQGNSGFVYDAGSVEKVCEPKIIVTAYGINDFMRKDIKQLEKDTIDFLKKVKMLYGSSKIVSILPLWTKWDGENKEFKRAERSCLADIYAKYSDYIIDGHKMIPHDIKCFDDEVHPNDIGFEHYGNNLATEISNILK